MEDAHAFMLSSYWLQPPPPFPITATSLPLAESFFPLCSRYSMLMQADLRLRGLIRAPTKRALDSFSIFPFRFIYNSTVHA